PSGSRGPSWRISTWTTPSQARGRPLTVAGLAMSPPVSGELTLMFSVAAPITHQDPSLPSLRSMTVVAGPVLLSRISTSPERASPARNGPAMTSLNPTKSRAKARAASTGSWKRGAVPEGNTAVVVSTAGAVVGVAVVVGAVLVGAAVVGEAVVGAAV